MKGSINNKNCLLTGATGGIGQEIASGLVASNCNLFLTARNRKKLKNLKSKLESFNSNIKISYEAVDLSNLENVRKLIKKTRKDFGQIDILINCAGRFLIKPITKCTMKDFDDSFNVNVRTPFLLCKEFSKDMCKNKWGRIVNIGSSSSYNGFKNGTIYCATKHSILGLSKSLQSELKENNVRTSCISPGSTKTEMAKISTDQDFNTFLDPKDVAEFIIFIIAFDKEMIVDEARLNRMIIK